MYKLGVCRADAYDAAHKYASSQHLADLMQATRLGAAGSKDKATCVCLHVRIHVGSTKRDECARLCIGTSVHHEWMILLDMRLPHGGNI